MRSVPYLAYVVCGLALGVILYLCWRANTHTGVNSEQEGFVSVTQLDPPTAPCNVDYGSLVQDQFLAENANRGSNTCTHQYPDPTVFGGEIRMQQSPKTFVFCTSKDASQLDNCPTECQAGGCVSLQSEADNITNATRKKTNQFIDSLNQFEDRQFGPMRNLFEGVSFPPASEYAEAEAEDDGPPLMLIQGVYPMIKSELARRKALIREMNSLQTDIQTATDAINKLKKHVAQQSLCEMSHPSALNPIPGIKSHYYKDSGVANPHKEPPTEDYSRYAGVAHGYSCFTQTPDSKKYAKWLNYNDIDGKTCAKVLKLKSAAGSISHGLIADDIRTKCEANQKCREQVKLIKPGTDFDKRWKHVTASNGSSALPNGYKVFPKIKAFNIGNETGHTCWTMGPDHKLFHQEMVINTTDRVPTTQNKEENTKRWRAKQKVQCDRIDKYPEGTFPGFFCPTKTTTT